jgi:hypothetical protein
VHSCLYQINLKKAVAALNAFNRFTIKQEWLIISFSWPFKVKNRSRGNAEKKALAKKIQI